MKSVLDRLQMWYASHCDGEWEHDYGVRIYTLDNPGWSVSIDLKGTALSGRLFAAVNIRNSDQDWIVGELEGGIVRIRCGPDNLSQALQLFLDWAEV